MWEADKFFPVFVSTVLVVIIIVLLIKRLISFTINYSKFDENEQVDEKKAWLERKVRKYFGLKFWLLTIFFFPFSIIYVCVKIAKYKTLQKELENIQKADSNKFQELYYKELYEKQKRENKKRLAQENQKENSE